MSVADQNNVLADTPTEQTSRRVEEIKIPMPWGHISGKWWGPIGQMPIVAVHGWQDNSGTFDLLIPHLPPDITVFAIDLPGHGLSSHYYKGQFSYVYWESLLALRRVVKYYKWKKVKLLGHSLGGAVSFLYAATYPNEVEFVIALDVVGPTIGDITKRISVTAAAIDRFLEYDSLNPDTAPAYTYDEVIKIAESAYGDTICRKGVETLMKRGTERCPNSDKYRFTRDSRLKVSMLGLLSLDLIFAYAAQIKCAYLNIRATDGIKSDQPEVYHKTLDIIKKGAKRFEYCEMEGTHYIHLNNPKECGAIINKFLST